MNPILTVEFTARTGNTEFKEEGIPLHSPEELLAYIGPGGGCEAIPNEVTEVNIIFLPPEHPNANNPIADHSATLQLGMVFLSGPLSEISRATNVLIDEAGRGGLSESFLKIIGPM